MQSRLGSADGYNVLLWAFNGPSPLLSSLSSSFSFSAPSSSHFPFIPLSSFPSLSLSFSVRLLGPDRPSPRRSRSPRRRRRRRRCLRSTRPFDRSRCIPHDIATVLLRLVSPYLLPRDHEREPDKRIDGQNGQRRMAHGPRDIWHVRIQIRLGRLRSLTHDTTEKGKRMLPRAKAGDVD